LKTHDYLQNIKINVVFLLNDFLFYMQNTVQCVFVCVCGDGSRNVGLRGQDFK